MVPFTAFYGHFEYPDGGAASPEEQAGRGGGAELRSGPERLSLSLGSAASAPAEQSTCFPSHCRGLPGIWDALVSLVLFDSVNSVNSRSSSIAAVAFSLGSNYLPALCPSPTPGAHAARGRPARGSLWSPSFFLFPGAVPPRHGLLSRDNPVTASHTVRVVRHGKRLRGDAVDAPSLETLKAGLERARAS